MAEHGAGRVRIAVLVGPAQLGAKTLEDSAANRGVTIFTTASAEQAYGFLGVAPPA